MSQYADKIKEVIVENLSVDEAQVTPDARIIEDLGADSLDAVELSMALEDELDIEVEDEEFANLVTVQDVLDYIEEKKK